MTQEHGLHWALEETSWNQGSQKRLLNLEADLESSGWGAGLRLLKQSPVKSPLSPRRRQRGRVAQG